jgi:hypothetical protein
LSININISKFVSKFLNAFDKFSEPEKSEIFGQTKDGKTVVWCNLENHKTVSLTRENNPDGSFRYIFTNNHEGLPGIITSDEPLFRTTRWCAVLLEAYKYCSGE